MASGRVDGVWRSRLRWRMRGAWLWPTFLALTVADGLLLWRLPVAGDRGSPAGALLLAMFFNLVAVAVGAPLLGRLVGRRRPELPRIVADDRAGTALLALVAAAVLGAGLAHRPGRLAERREFRAQSDAVRRYVSHQAPASYRVRIDEADTWKQADHLYRTCVPPGPAGPRLPLCLLVDTTQSPAGVRVDSDHTPNDRYIGPGNPARRRG